jgi:hypothetical protein
MPIIELLCDKGQADSGPDIFRSELRRLLFSFGKGDWALTFKSELLLKCSRPFGLGEES